MQDTKTPVKVAVVALAANVVFSIILMNQMKHSGLALANSLASGVNFFILFLSLRQKLIRVDGKRILLSFGKSLLASGLMGMLGWLILHGQMWQIHGQTVTKTIYLISTIVFCIIIYLLAAYLLKSEEVSYVIALIKQRYRKNTEDS
jgi:putative peptidoglycan lipid II flippase